jgi:hypothetical protein
MERQLYYYEYVDRSADDVVRALAGPEHAAFEAATDGAVAEANQFRERLHVELAGLDVGKDVVIEVGTARDKGFAVFVPIKWHAASQTGLFPSMEGELEIVPLSYEPPRSQIGLLGRYRPPIGVFGAIGDAMLGHRIAEATVRRFVMELGARLSLKQT